MKLKSCKSFGYEEEEEKFLRSQEAEVLYRPPTNSTNDLSMYANQGLLPLLPRQEALPLGDTSLIITSLSKLISGLGRSTFPALWPMERIFDWLVAFHGKGIRFDVEFTSLPCQTSSSGDLLTS